MPFTGGSRPPRAGTFQTLFLFLSLPFFITMNSSIIVSERDAKVLRKLLNVPPSAQYADKENFRRLSQELSRATVVPVADLPPDVVALDSTVELENLGTGERLVFTLVLPDEADPTDGRLSVLAPLGTGLLGFRTGEEIEWPVPSGTIRVRLDKVSQANYQ